MGRFPREEITRLEAFSDAVFGFALTLLVVSLDVPRSYDELMGIMAGFPSFACCLALLIWLWYEHNSFFRRFNPHDGITILINAGLLFLVLFYVYPLKFMFDSMFARWVTLPNPPAPMALWQLANASAVYALGFVLMMLMFVLLYARAYARRDAIGLSERDVFELKSLAGHHMVSVSVGLLAMAIALWGPLWSAPFSPVSLSLMGPGHFAWALYRSKHQHALTTQPPQADAGSHRLIVPRNAEVIRQWSILRELEASRRMTIDDLASRTGVTTRTIRRDLAALQESGFTLFDELIDGKRYWMLEAKAFKRLDDTGFTLAELSALYFSRTLVECLAATPFQQDVGSAFNKLSAALTPAMRQFLDKLPLVIQAKGSSPRTTGAGSAKAEREHIARLLDATLNHRRATMKYFSLSSSREKEYVIEPYRLVYAPGGMYLLAFVPEYKELRTFSIDRIRHISLHEERFTPTEIPDAAFAHSLGVNQGPPEHVEIAFEPRIAPYVRERQWHASQKTADRKDGGVVLSLEVCNDWALRSWILSFGPLARVLSPPALATQIKDEIDRAAERYAVE